MSSGEGKQLTKPGPTGTKLSEILSQIKTFAPPAGIGNSLETTNTSEATEEEWKKFFSVIQSLPKVPVTMMVERPLSTASNGGSAQSAIDWAWSNAGTLHDKYVGSSFDDKEGRSQWTAAVVSAAYNNNWNYNYVICDDSHRFSPNGSSGTDYASRTYSYSLHSVHANIDYTLYALRDGVFTLYGDGGYLNWAYIGSVVVDTGGNPRVVVFK